jgi:DUF971 family protein
MPGVRVTWSDGHVSVFEGRALRQACACAACVHEWSGQPLLDPATISPDVRAEAIELTGRYGIRIRWSDGHDTGIYTYDRLRALCPCEGCVSERGGETAEPGG